MSEHKLQSADETSSFKLSKVPKMMEPLVKYWVPKAFIVSFKLETDASMLQSKAKKALQNYGHNLVIANLLQTRKTQVIIFSSQPDKQPETIKLCREEIENEVEIEMKIVQNIMARHLSHLNKT